MIQKLEYHTYPSPEVADDRGAGVRSLRLTPQSKINVLPGAVAGPEATPRSVQERVKNFKVAIKISVVMIIVIKQNGIHSNVFSDQRQHCHMSL